MNVIHPEFVPDPSLSRAEMEVLQRDIAAEAVFEDALDFDPTAVSAGSTEHDDPAGAEQTELGDLGAAAEVAEDADGDADTATGDSAAAESPVVVGVDQAFAHDGDTAVSAIVALQDGEVIERVHATEPTEIPYIPGLLSFREGGAILAAFEELSVDPDLAVVDGSGRIHFRQAGIATHIGVTLDLPAVGVAKSLLCGRPQDSLDSPLPEGIRVPIESNERVDAPDGTIIGYALQSRQYDNPEKRHVNPLYVSPGHRVGAETATDLVWQLCAGYKLPEPTRLADGYADEVKRSL